MRSLLLILLVLICFAGCTTDSAQVVLQSISINPNTVTITAGNVMQLKPVFIPSTFSAIAVEWGSSDATIASISSTGVLNAIKPGKITIAIKDKNSATMGKCIVVVQ